MESFGARCSKSITFVLYYIFFIWNQHGYQLYIFVLIGMWFSHKSGFDFQPKNLETMTTVKNCKPVISWGRDDVEAIKAGWEKVEASIKYSKLKDRECTDHWETAHSLFCLQETVWSPWPSTYWTSMAWWSSSSWTWSNSGGFWSWFRRIITVTTPTTMLSMLQMSHRPCTVTCRNPWWEMRRRHFDTFWLKELL